MYAGLLGGTFDPIHFGHLAAAEGVRHLLGLDRVIFMPNRQPPHKGGQSVTSAEHRVAMVRLAIAGNPWFECSTLELAREGPSYTIDTIRAIQAEHADWRMALLVGMDSLLEIQTWREYQELLRMIDLVAVSRPGYPAERQNAALAALGPELARRIRVLEIPGVAVSATELRHLAAQGYPLRYLVPEAVAAHIAAHGLYA